MIYRRCGNQGLKLPAISLGLWHNFGNHDDLSTAQSILRYAFDAGITHFDLANNYGPLQDLQKKILAEFSNKILSTIDTN